MAKKEHDEKQKTVQVTVKNVSVDKQFTMPQPAPPPPKQFTAGATGYVAASKADLEKQKEREEKMKSGKPDEPLIDLAPDEEKTIEVPVEQMHVITPTLEDAQMRGFIQWSAPGHVSGRPTFGLPGGTVVAKTHQHAGEVALAEQNQKKAESPR